MKFVNECGTEIEVVEMVNSCVTFKITIENHVHTDIDCWTKESFWKMIKENGYKIA